MPCIGLRVSDGGAFGSGWLPVEQSYTQVPYPMRTMVKMKTLTLILAMSTLCLVNARSESIPEKAANAADTAARTAGNVAHAAVRHTKEAVNTVADALTPEPGARHVDVSLTEDRIDMPTSMPHGRTAFIVHNAGQRKHNFEVVGHGTDRKFVTDVQPGQTKVLHVDLHRGSYTANFPTDRRHERGTQVGFRVR